MAAGRNRSLASHAENGAAVACAVAAALAYPDFALTFRLVGIRVRDLVAALVPCGCAALAGGLNTVRSFRGSQTVLGEIRGTRSR